MNRLGSIVLIAIVLVGVVIYAFYSFFSPFSSTKEPLQVLLGTRLAAYPFNLVDGSLVDVRALPETSIVSRVKRPDLGTTVSAILPANTIANTILIEDRDGNRTLEDSGTTIKDTVALSPEGQFVAYAELAIPFGEALYSDDIADWRIKLVNLATEETVDVGMGFAPHFVYTELGDRLVIFSTPNGVASYAIDSEERADVFTTIGTLFTPHAAQASPNGDYIAVYNPTTDRYGIFTFSVTVPPRLSGYGGVPVRFEQITLTNEHVYGVMRNEETNQRTLVRYRIEDLPVVGAPSETVYTFADEEVPYQIIP